MWYNINMASSGSFDFAWVLNTVTTCTQICSFYYCFGQKMDQRLSTNINISWEGISCVCIHVHYSSFSPPNQKYLLPPLGGEERKKESRGGEIREERRWKWVERREGRRGLHREKGCTMENSTPFCMLCRILLRLSSNYTYFRWIEQGSCGVDAHVCCCRKLSDHDGNRFRTENAYTDLDLPI